jgi:hypothetical protein
MALQGTSTHSVWPSAFQWVEQPLYNLNEERNKGVSDSDFKWVMARQYVYWPLVMCATPVTCLADVAAGIAESALSVYQGEGLSRVPSILHKKIIASPLQHLIFLGTNMVVPVMFGLVFTLEDAFSVVQYVNQYKEVVRTEWKWDFSNYKACFLIPTILFGPLAGMPAYHVAQEAVGRLSDWAHPEGFNIFINGGCLDPSGRKMTDSDYAEKAYKDYLSKCMDDHISSMDPELFRKINERRNAILREMGLREINFNPKPRRESTAQRGSWADFIQPFQEKITLIHKSPDQLDVFEKFNNAFKNGMSARECLGISSDKPTLAEIKKAYLKLALVLHPDRNPPERKEIADMLMKSITAARAHLEHL